MKISTTQNNFCAKHNLQNKQKTTTQKQKANFNDMDRVSFQKRNCNGFKKLIKKAFSWADFNLTDNIFEDFEKDIYENLCLNKERKIIRIDIPKNLPKFSSN